MKLLTLLFGVAAGLAASSAAEAQLVLPGFDFTPKPPQNLQERADSLGCSMASFHALPNEVSSISPLKGWIDCQGGRLYGGTRYVYNGGSWDGPYQFTALIYGGIYYRFLQEGGDAALGFPLTDEQDGGDGWGRYNIFHNGYTQTAIFYTPDTGPKLLYGGILARYLESGAQDSWLRYPVTEEQDGPNGLRYVHFQGGAISWSPDTSTRLKYLNYGQELDVTILAQKGTYAGPDALNSAANAAMNACLSGYGRTNNEWGVFIVKYPDGSFDLAGMTEGKNDHVNIKVRLDSDQTIIADVHVHPVGGEQGPSTKDWKVENHPPQGWLIDAGSGRRWYFNRKTKKLTELDPIRGYNPAKDLPNLRLPPASKLEAGIPMWSNAIPQDSSADAIVKLGVEGAVEVFLNGGGILELDEDKGQALHPGGTNGGGLPGFFPKFW